MPRPHGEGFDLDTARLLASRYGIDRVLWQLDWIDQRAVKRNRLGTLRLSIERDWAKPTAGIELGRPNPHPAEDPLASVKRALAQKLRFGITN